MSKFLINRTGSLFRSETPFSGTFLSESLIWIVSIGSRLCENIFSNSEISLLRTGSISWGFIFVVSMRFICTWSWSLTSNIFDWPVFQLRMHGIFISFSSNQTSIWISSWAWELGACFVHLSSTTWSKSEFWRSAFIVKRFFVISRSWYVQTFINHASSLTGSNWKFLGIFEISVIFVLKIILSWSWNIFHWR